MLSLRRLSKKTLTVIFVVEILGLLILWAIFSPTLHQNLGNTFFGGIPKLYNLQLAHFFFKQSANPIAAEAVPFAHYQLSRTYFIQGKLDEALQEAKKELKFYPAHTRAYYILGLTYGYMNQEEKAIDAFAKFIEAHPETWAARNDKAWLEFRIGRTEDAIATIAPVTHLRTNPWVQNTYGALLMNLGFYEDAYEAFQYAKNNATQMTEEAWGVAYPGNDPRIYETGLNAMRLSIENNLAILRTKQK